MFGLAKPGNPATVLLMQKLRGLNLSKPHRMSTGTADVHPIQKQHMKVDIQVQCAAKSLDQGHGAGLCHRLCEARFVRQVRGDGTVDDTQCAGHDFGITGKQKPQRKGYAKHPLSHA